MLGRGANRAKFQPTETVCDRSIVEWLVELDQLNRPLNLASFNEKANRYRDDCNYQQNLDHSRHRHFRPRAAPIVAPIHRAANRLYQRIDPETSWSCQHHTRWVATLVSEGKRVPS